MLTMGFGRILVVLVGILIIMAALGFLNMGVGSVIEFIIGALFLAHGLFGIFTRRIQNVGSLIFGFFLLIDSLNILDLKLSQIIWIMIGCILISLGMARVRGRWYFR